MEGTSLEGSFGKGFADHFSSLGDVLSSQIVWIFNIDLIDLVGPDFFFIGDVHQVDFARVITELVA